MEYCDLLVAPEIVENRNSEFMIEDAHIVDDHAQRLDKKRPLSTLKYANAQQIEVAIRRVLEGEYSLDREVATELLLRLIEETSEKDSLTPISGGSSSELTETVSKADSVEPLTPREADVLCLIARGRGNQEIARDLYVSISTVKKYVHRLFVKLEVSDRTQAAIKAIELGLLYEGKEH